MYNHILRKAKRYAARRHSRQMWHRIVGCLACVVMFYTIYALMFPAATLEDTGCGLTEHTHSVENDCYAEDGTTLTCEQEEHSHTEACLTPPESVPTYICGMGEHTHSEDCYDEDGTTLTCELEEHTHTEACLPPSESGPAYTCGMEEHTHSAENGCYADDGTTLICGLTEHTHTEQCNAGADQAEEGTALTEEEQVQAVIALIDALPTEEEIEETFTALLEAEDEEGYEAALIDLIEKAKEAYAAYSALSDELKAKVTNVAKLMDLEAYWSGDAFVPGDPNFTVQYYAYLPVAATSGSGNTLTLIDTSGRRLPSNGADGVSATKSLYLKEADNGRYEIAIDTELTKVYETYDYQFSTADELVYINRLKDNGNYRLKAIWVLKDGKDASSTNESDWTSYPATAGFTNNPASAAANSNTILIEDNTVIRLVYDTTSTTYTNAVNFYDYDITDGSQRTNINGAGQGINSTSNYSGSGSELAFGNQNTGTPYGLTPWNGNLLNAYNGSGGNKSYAGCTFGLVTELDSNGYIQYANQVDAPKLFNDGTAAGKTSYTNGEYDLQFDRVGDTYTLSAVGNAGLSGLQYFNHPRTGDTTYTNIWTNNFWPMDSRPGKDGLTGQFTGLRNADGNPVGCETFCSRSGETFHYPSSDDGLAHNNMFGMQYAVEFTLTEDYVGPLEYYFFGDDDMWVFLDGQLICDIGGVHSSVGEYVNLWDYITKGSTGTHTLSFFYTERGLSGSTCYMRFTLPSVSSATPGQQLGSLQVEKEVTGQTSGQEFTFTLGLSTNNQYSYSKMNRDGSVASTGTIANGGPFTLSDGQYIVVNNLPYGTTFTVTETAVDGCIVTNTVNGTASSDGSTAAGTISSSRQNVTVHYTNRLSPKLPDTGGSGTGLYTIGGLTLMAGAALWGLVRRKKEIA